MKINYIKEYSFLVVLLLFISCKKTNWKENFREKEKSPFGTYVLFNEAKELFHTKEIHYLKENVYDYLYHNYEDEGADFGNYICIKNTAYKLNETGLNDLLSSVYNGGSNLFLSLNYFSEFLKETLEITTNNLDKNVFTPSQLKALNGKFTLENDKFKEQPYTFDRNIRRHYFVTYNENKTIVLGNTEIVGEKVPNFIKIYHGKGAVYLHTNPIVFTNYYLLNGNEKYAENLLSYLPLKNVLWDPQIRSSKLSKNNNDKESIFKFFLKHPTLKWFLFVSLFGLLLFIIFNARRKQRPIPIIEPLKNSTLEFTHTIANLYLKEEDHKNLVDKKITYFLEKIRTKYLIDTSNLNSKFIEQLALKSGNRLANTKYLINTIITLNKKAECSKEELIVLNKMIESFFK